MGKAGEIGLKTEAGGEEPQRSEGASGFTCEICIEPNESIKKFKNGGLCDHPFCLECIAKYIEAQVESRVGGIKCPGLSCNHQLDPISCRPFLPTPLFQEWCDILCSLKVLEFKNCYCPFQDCSALVLDECQGISKKAKCPNCKKDFCFQCQLPWHAGYRCDESQQFRDRNDILFGKLIEQKKWTRCRRCGWSIELTHGCSVVQCRCGLRFCHQCGEPGHFGPCDRPKSCVWIWTWSILLFITVQIGVVLLIVYFGPARNKSSVLSLNSYGYI